MHMLLEKGDHFQDVRRMTRAQLEEALYAAQDHADAAEDRAVAAEEQVSQSTQPSRPQISPEEEESIPRPRNMSKVTPAQVRRMLGPDFSKLDYNNIRTNAQHNFQGTLPDYTQPWVMQKGSGLERAVNTTNKAHPVLRKFRGYWLTEWFIQTYWNSVQDYEREKAQGKKLPRSMQGTPPPTQQGSPSGDHDDLDNQQPPQQDDDDDPSNRNPPPFNNPSPDDDGLTQVDSDGEPTQTPPPRPPRRSQQEPGVRKKKRVRKVVYEEVSSSEDDGQMMAGSARKRRRVEQPSTQ